MGILYKKKKTKFELLSIIAIYLFMFAIPILLNNKNEEQPEKVAHGTLTYREGIRGRIITIINDGNLEDFEKFLNESSVECKLSYIELNGDKNITFNFGDIQLDFWSIASTGTKSLTLLYFWYKELQKSKFKSLIFIDEFDAFYHHRLSYSVVKRLIELDAQVILTTHDINIMSNDLMRPDCYFIMSQSEITSISQKTKKELRVAHNLEKMYRAGSFGN